MPPATIQNPTVAAMGNVSSANSSTPGGNAAPTVTPTTVYGGNYSATNNPFVTSPVTPPTSTPSTVTSSAPVITADAAEANLANLTKTFNDLQASVSQQKSTLAQAAAQKAADDAKANLTAAQLAIQQQDSNTAAATAAAKTAAANALNSPTTSTTDTSATNTTGTTGTGTTGTTGAPNAPAPVTSDTSNYTDALNSNLNSYTSGISSISSEEDQLTSQMTSQLSSLMAGTFPLSSTQSALITSLQNQLTTNTALQTQANTANTGAATEAAMRGGGQYTPGQAAGTIANTISTGVLKIQQLDNSAASTMAQLENSFQTQDYNLISKSYDVLQQQLTDKGTALKDMYDATTSNIQFQMTAAATAAKTAFDENMQSDTFDLTKAQDIIDNGLKQGQLDESWAAEAQKSINDKVTQSIAEYNAGLIPGGTFNASTGTFTDSTGTSGTSPTSLPGYTTAANGSPIVQHPNGDTFYVGADGSLTKMSPTDAATFSQYASASNTISQMQTLFSKFSSGYDASSQSDTQQYDSMLKGLPTDIQAMLPSPSLLSGGVLSSIGATNYTGKFTSAFSAANSRMSSVAPNAIIPQFGQSFPTMAAAGAYLTSTGQTSFYTNLQSQGYSDAQILQIING